ncbi:hypothetical protein [Roseovarius sp. D22-M7]|uniref:hypothetical protein n=1 Tax=Roseovarius sp. D22-M7 TaxID=3127116 RepID=UPI00301042B9
MELYNRVCRACHVEGMSKSEAARVFGIDRKTVAKILKHSVPPGCRRMRPPVRPKLDPFVRTIDQIPEDDKDRLKTQRHTAKRIHERLRDEHGVTGGITIVTGYVRERKRRRREGFRAAVAPAGSRPGGFRRGTWRDHSPFCSNQWRKMARRRMQAALCRDDRHWERHWSGRQWRRRIRTRFSSRPVGAGISSDLRPGSTASMT